MLWRDISKIKHTLSLFGVKQRMNLIFDMVNERRLNDIPYDEYLLFNFHNIKDKAIRASFVSDIERVQIANLLNDSSNEPIFYDKGLTYKTYRRFYKRDVLRITDSSDLILFKDFIYKHKSFIAKPIDGGCGVGIKIIHFDDKKDSSEELFNRLNTDYNNKCIVEEFIQQDDSLSKFHPQSVNTVRVPTIRFDNRVEIFHPFFRIGQGGCITDNAGSGGIICALDVKTGEIIATADEFGNKYDSHPDTHQQLLGVKLPHWEELIRLSKEMALVVPTNRYSSWDLALTESGWELVEANARGQFVWQYATQIGFKEEITRVLEEIGLVNNHNNVCL